MGRNTHDSPQPDFSFEAKLHDEGFALVCGIDEAGRGPLAGPVVAAAVILDRKAIPGGLHDSKKLTEKKRVALFDAIVETSTVAIASVSAQTIDRINIRAASLLAMRMAASGLENVPDYALIYGNALPDGLDCPATALVKGDARSLSIAAASIIAKVTRDRIMIRQDGLYPDYGFSGHKGYPTKTHRETLLRIGPSPIHRRSFAPVRAALGR